MNVKANAANAVEMFTSVFFEWIDTKFWRMVNVKVDKYVKEDAAERELSILMSVLELSNFVHL